ncbi:MAG: hypothetical protein HW421_1544 [Ignavibacteria bacterium]|nr:hypothetical protein [Ignavibacteria bacterium]
MKIPFHGIITIPFRGFVWLLLIIVVGLLSCENDQYAVGIAPEIKLSCDTNKVSFKDFIKPIIDERCKTCHNNTSQYGGVNLDGYENIKINSVSGKLYNSIRFGNMSNYISDDCDIAKIKAWRNQGSKNN